MFFVEKMFAFKRFLNSYSFGVNQIDGNHVVRAVIRIQYLSNTSNQ